MDSDRAATRRRRRQLQEQLRALTYEPLMRGSVVERRRKCGKPNCACASDPDARHGGKVVTVFLDGSTQALPVRSQDESRVRRAVEAYARAWRIINGLTACELADLRREARERRRSRRRRRAQQ
jgi:prepilin-type processing-associated H-X9-DG protein